MDALDALREFAFGDGTPLTITVEKPLTAHGQRLADSLGVRVEVRPVAVATPERRALAARAQQLRAAGKVQREIAEELGVSRSYAAALAGDDPLGEKAAARKDSYAGTCVDCGGPTDGSNGPTRRSFRCLSCALAFQRASKIWTREAVIDALHRFAALHGRAPTATEWMRADPERGYPSRSACYRSTSDSSAPFLTWNDALAAAELPRRSSGTRLPKGEGRTPNMARQFIVLSDAGDGTWKEHTTEAYNEVAAIEQVATEPGRSAAIRADTFRVREVAPETRMTVKLETAPA